MRKVRLVSLISLLAGVNLLSSCAWGTSTQANVAAPATQPVMSVPARVYWHMSGNPVISDRDFAFAAHVVDATERDTIILYSVSGAKAQDITANSRVYMRDDAGKVYTLIRIVPLAQFDQLQFGAIVFSPRRSALRQLHLLFPSPGQPDLDVVVAEADDPGADPSLLALNTFAVYREGYLQQAGYTVSFNDWGPQKGDRVAQMLSDKGITLTESVHQFVTEEGAHAGAVGVTSTPIPENQLAIELSAGKALRREITLRIEDQSRQVQYLYIVILADGDVKAALLEATTGALLPTPTPGPTPTPAPLPAYPAPGEGSAPNPTALPAYP